ncbi:hypothetical protein TRAPUB_13844 [Trametes pubescens]|uniref:Uncharacterized protein n=1 Tax=Trametes pubescens TaxID=154538 RepID=A0A1M2VQ76_TRAPU|nr:hypothetical protein TRAPUB_13844 [Trametes pubescens]
MFEPDKPITIYAKYTPFPAYLLESDEGKPLKPSYVILRHRHLVQQQRLIQGPPPTDHAGAKPTRGTSVPPRVDSVRSPLSADGRAIMSFNQGPQTSATASLPTILAAQQASAEASADLPNTNAQHNTNAQEVSAPRAGASSSLPQPQIPLPVLHQEISAHTSDGQSSRELHVSRHQRGIRSRGEKTTWFASTSGELLLVPPDIPTACFSDLYVHSSPNGVQQVWLRSATAQWLSIELSHPHPYLKGYILNFCANREPSWVTKATMTTYNGRAKRREKLEGKGRSPAPGCSDSEFPGT